MTISYLTTTLNGEKEKTLPVIHETDDYKAGLEIEPRILARIIMKLEQYSSRIDALGKQAKVIDIRVSPINTISINW